MARVLTEPDFLHPNLLEWVDHNRKWLIWAGLTLIQNWLAAGRPHPSGKPLGSYQSWSSVIGGILEQAGIGGFLSNLEEFYEIADHEGTILRRLFASWVDKFGTKEVSTADLLPLAIEIDGLDIRGRDEGSQRKSLGRKLAKQRDRVIGDYRLVQSGTEHRAGRWQLLHTRMPLEI